MVSLKWKGLERGARGLRGTDKHIRKELQGALTESGATFQSNLRAEIPWSGRRGFPQSFKGAVDTWKPRNFRTRPDPLVVIGPKPRAPITNLWGIHEKGMTITRYGRPARYRKQAWMEKAYKRTFPLFDRLMRRVLGRSIRAAVRGG